MYADIPTDLRRLIEPIVQEHGLELVDVDFARGRPPWRLRVMVDNPEMDGRVPVDRCAEVSRELGARLDAAGAIETRYTLEVTTPGFDRVLAREKDFLAARGAESASRRAAPRTGGGASAVAWRPSRAARCACQVEGREVVIPFAEVAKANCVYEFTREDFARAAASRPATDQR